MNLLSLGKILKVSKPNSRLRDTNSLRAARPGEVGDRRDQKLSRVSRVHTGISNTEDIQWNRFRNLTGGAMVILPSAEWHFYQTPEEGKSSSERVSLTAKSEN